MKFSLFACAGVFAGLLAAQNIDYKTLNYLLDDYNDQLSLFMKVQGRSKDLENIRKELRSFADKFAMKAQMMKMQPQLTGVALVLKKGLEDYDNSFNESLKKAKEAISKLNQTKEYKERELEIQKIALEDALNKAKAVNYNAAYNILEKLQSVEDYKEDYKKISSLVRNVKTTLNEWLPSYYENEKSRKDRNIRVLRNELEGKARQVLFLIEKISERNPNEDELDERILADALAAVDFLHDRSKSIPEDSLKKTEKDEFNDLQISYITRALIDNIVANTSLNRVKARLNGENVSQEEKTKLRKILNQGSSQRITDIGFSPEDENYNFVARSLSGLVFSNKAVQNAAENFEFDELGDFISNLSTSLQNSAKELNNIANTEVLKYSTTVATDNRLAKLSNPNNENQKLASLIKEFENKPLAGEMSSVISAYTDRFDYANNAWVNILSAYAKLQNKGSQNLYGLNFGFDKAFDDYILGSYLGYANSKFKNKLSQNKSDNIILGIYLRKFLENDLQLDARFYGSTIKNKLSRSFDGVKSILNQNAKFDSYSIATALELGKVFSFKNDQLFIKPLLGLEYKFLRNDGFKEKGDVPVELSQVSFKSLSAKLGSEFKYYLGNNFIFLTPSIEKDLSSTGDKVANVRFVGSTESFALILDENKKKTYFSLSAGGDLALSNNLSLNLTLGTKLSKENKFYNANLGLKYKY